MEGQSILGGRPEARSDSRDLLLCEAAGTRAEGTVKWKLGVFFSNKKETGIFPTSKAQGENNNLNTGNATFHMQIYTWV